MVKATNIYMVMNSLICHT